MRSAMNVVYNAYCKVPRRRSENIHGQAQRSTFAGASLRLSFALPEFRHILHQNPDLARTSP